MARLKKEGQKKSFLLKQEIVYALEKYAQETGLSLTAIVEKALQEYLGVGKKKL